MRTIRPALVVAVLLFPAHDVLAQRAPPPRIDPIFTFENDVLVEQTRDENRDGKTDDWMFFKEGKAIRHEHDFDGDGQADWRTRWDGTSLRRALTVQEIDGRWRILPHDLTDPDVRVPNPRMLDARTFRGRTEKQVEGKWTANFEDTQKLAIDGNYANDAPWRTDVTVQWKYAEGRPVEATYNAEGGGFHPPNGTYLRVTWKDGLPLSLEQGNNKDQLLNVEKYDKGEWIEKTVYDAKGAPLTRTVGGPKNERREKYVDGKWSGEFEELTDYTRVRYRNGKQFEYEYVRNFNGFTGVAYRYTHDKNVLLTETYYPKGSERVLRKTLAEDGSYVEELLDADGKSTQRTHYRADGLAWKIEKWTDGKWTGDFEGGSADLQQRTYKGGRLVQEIFGPKMANYTYGNPIRKYPDAQNTEWSDGEKTHHWFRCRDDLGLNPPYRIEMNWVPSLEWEARDLDGDGVADLKVDYVKLTIEQPGKAAGTLEKPRIDIVDMAKVKR